MLDLTIAGTMRSHAILAPERFLATGPTCSAAKPPVKNNSHPGQRRCLSKTGKPLTISMGCVSSISLNIGSAAIAKILSRLLLLFFNMCGNEVRTWGPAIKAQSICDLATEFACMENCNLPIIRNLIVGRSSIKFTPLESKQEGCSAERDSIVRKTSETRFLRDFCPFWRHRAAQKPGFLAHRNENRHRKASGRSSVGGTRSLKGPCSAYGSTD